MAHALELIPPGKVISASGALSRGLIDLIDDDPIAAAMKVTAARASAALAADDRSSRERW
ncbi:hypothetical protein [Mesorhizobium sp. YR577]|uniref:hypothetical protein n=1 Tax=Mesorhizobium sp. YR577 TaxID=1884373 RepID=UPI0008F11D56|nr:hypothetical protein [Mesorhizobium sp. YR577]SFU22683.1 hypothetical protein SAMN05518861_1399 [Mesorhizobium sp. YR577]